MSPNAVELTLTIKGMDCAGCARTVETGVARLTGVEGCELSFATERLRVRGTIDRETVVRRVRELGYEVAEPTETFTAPRAAPRPVSGFLGFIWQRTETRLALFGALLVLPGLILTELLGLDVPWAAWLAVLALALTGWPIARSAWRSLLISRELTINALMTIAEVGAVIIGAYV